MYFRGLQLLQMQLHRPHSHYVYHVFVSENVLPLLAPSWGYTGKIGNNNLGLLVTIVKYGVIHFDLAKRTV